MSAANLQHQSTAAAQITCNPRFMCGVKSDVQNSIFFIDESILLYPCGHNIVFYSMQDRSQRFIPGIEGTEGITCLNMNASRRLLAVCETSSQAICSIYQISKIIDSIKEKKGAGAAVDPIVFKKRKVILMPDSEATQFLSVEFCPQNDKILATLSGGPDFRLNLWQWDKQRGIAQTSLQILPSQMPRHLSFNPMDQNVLIVTGKDVYRYFKQQENGTFKTIHKEICPAKNLGDLSTDISCHAWMADGRFVLCNEKGQIMLLESNGDYKGFTITATGKSSITITAVVPFSIGSGEAATGAAGAKGAASTTGSNARTGFIIASLGGQFRVFMKSDAESRQPYKSVDSEDLQPHERELNSNPQLDRDLTYMKVASMALSPKEDNIVFTMSSNQIFKVPISLDSRNSDDLQRYDYLISGFHSHPIFGMDVCLKKTIIATCSSDRTVRVWDYGKQQHALVPEIVQQFEEEAFSVAVHPSGFHMIVGFSDSIRMLNILQEELQEYHRINIQGSHEIKFAYGGHLFACQNGKNVQVFNFYTAESPEKYLFKGHTDAVKCIFWLEDDSGFITTGKDNDLALWRLHPGSGDGVQNPGETNPIWKFSSRKAVFNAVCVYRPEGGLPLVYTASSDKTIREVEQKNLQQGNNKIDAKDLVSQGQELVRYEESIMYSQLVCSAHRKVFFAGIAESNRPGGIHLIKHPFEKVCEVQAHSSQVERMAMSYDNKWLFSAGNDGTLCVFKFENKELASKKNLLPLPVQVSQFDEIMIQMETKQRLTEDIARLQADIQNVNSNNQAQLAARQAQYNADEEALKAKSADQKELYRQQKHSLEEETVQVEREGREELEFLEKVHDEEMRAKRREYEEKKFADDQRYRELEQADEEQDQEFKMRLAELVNHQKKQLKEMVQMHELERAAKDKEYTELQQQIKDLQEKSRVERTQLEDEQWEKIDEIKDRNKEELAKMIETGMESKGQLTEVTGEFKTRRTKKESSEKDSQEKQSKLNDMTNITTELRQQIQSYKTELKEREQTMQDKEANIYELKKKTQELEKFKFVLDYKIKELKRDIGPREDDIQKLQDLTSQMQQEVGHFFRVKANLSLIVDDLLLRQDGLKCELKELMKNRMDQDASMRKFKDDVLQCLNHITDFKKLKKSVVRLYKTYVLEEGGKSDTGDNEMNKQYKTKRQHLEKNVNHLRSVLTKDKLGFKNMNTRFMQENVQLLQEINVLIREQHTLTKNIEIMNGVQGSGGVGGAGDSLMSNERVTEAEKELKMQEIAIDQFLSRIAELEQENDMLEQRRIAHSGTRLPPIHRAQHDEEEVDQHYDSVEVDEHQQVIQQSEEYVAQQQTEEHYQRTEVHQEIEHRQEVVETVIQQEIVVPEGQPEAVAATDTAPMQEESAAHDSAMHADSGPEEQPAPEDPPAEAQAEEAQDNAETQPVSAEQPPAEEAQDPPAE